MALADTARLIASLDLKGNFNAQLRASEKALGSFDARLDKTQSRAYRAGQQIGTGIKAGAAIAAGAIGFLAANVGLGLKSLSELESITTQTNAVLKSTKGVSGETAKSIRALAEQYESLNATIDDKVIQSGENLLLTFRNIRKDAFEPALRAALDMNTALGRGESGLQGTIQQLGVALNDPIKGLTRLQRAGIIFTKQQKDQITTAVKAGDTFKAQTIILDELNRRYGGSFLAGGNTTTGKIAKFKDAIEDLQKALATALLPTIGKVADALSKFLARPDVVKGIESLGQKIASLFSDKNLAAGGRFLEDMFNTAKSAAPVVESSARATFEIVKAAVGLFKSLPEPLQQLAVGAFAVNKLTGGLVTNVAGGVFDTLKDLFLKQRGATPANPLFVSDVTGGLGGIGKALGGAGAAEGAAGAAGLGAVGSLAALTAGVTVSALGIMGLGWLINATSSPEQMAATAQNISDAERRRYGGPAAAATNRAIEVSRTFGAGTSETVGIRNAIRDQTKALLFSGKQADDRSAADRTHLGQALNAEFDNLVRALRDSRGDKAIKTAVESALKVIESGRGGSTGAQNTVSQLKAALQRTHDPQLQREIRSAIAKVESKIPGRQFRERELRTAQSIFRSHQSTDKKIADLKTIERQLKDHGMPNAAKTVREKIQALQHAQTTAQHGTTQAIKDKDLSVHTTVNVSSSVNVNARNVARAEQSYDKFYVTGK